MHIKTIEEEIPVTKEDILIYKAGIEKELRKLRPPVDRLEKVLEIVNLKLKRMP